MGGSQAFVFVQVYGAYFLKVYVAIGAHFAKPGVCANRGGAGGKAQNAVRLADDLCGHDIGGAAAHSFVIFFTVNLHHNGLLSF